MNECKRADNGRMLQCQLIYAWRAMSTHL